VKYEPNNERGVVTLTNLLRSSKEIPEDERYEESAEIFREKFNVVKSTDRVFYSEWGTVEGLLGNRNLSIWLVMLSLVDKIGRKQLSRHSARTSFANLAKSFYELYESFHVDMYIRATHASALLGLKLNPRNDRDESNYNNLQRNLQFSKAQGIKDMKSNVALSIVIDAAAKAWGEREIDLELLRPEDVTYNEVERLFT